MGSIFYSVFLFTYKVGLYLASPFHAKARTFLKGRKDIWKQVETIGKDKGKRIWIHCASLGEFEQGRPVMEKLRQSFPNHKIVLTFFSPSGYEVRKNYTEADFVFYLPLDSHTNAVKWVSGIAPSLVLFVKYEYWHHYIKELAYHQIPILSVSAIFRSNQIYFTSYGQFYRNILQRITHFFVQDTESKNLLEKAGITQVTVSGDTRFDRVLDIRKAKKEYPAVNSFKGEATLMVAGSVWPEDMDILTTFINNHSLKFIIVPHEINDRFMERIEKDIEKSCLRFSKIHGSNEQSADVLIIDNVGMLSSLYAYGDFAWVGGAYGQGLHNILEAAVYGCPVFFGNKNYNKFREARDLINLGGAAAIANYMELKEQFANFSEANTYQIARQINVEYIESNKGATDKIVHHCTKLIS
jgi:3-deoxy-D-manno-octulosonic-acid transferase